MALLPQVKRALPACAAADAEPRASSRRCSPRRSSCAAFATRAACAPRRRSSSRASCRSRRRRFALRGGELAAYHGAEHISIGRYEHGDGAQKEHERCGGHLVGPLVATSAVGNVLAGLAPERMRNHARAAAQIGAVAASTEIFGWMTRNPDNLVAQALSKPGHELQHRFSTAEPTPEQLEVAEAALAACLELEHGADHQN